MKKLNKKGFTLIELLAVIVILGVLMLVAIPAVTRYIERSRRSSFVSNVSSYIDAASNQVAYKGANLGTGGCVQDIGTLQLDKKPSGYSGYIKITKDDNDTYTYSVYITNNDYHFENVTSASITEDNATKGSKTMTTPTATTEVPLCNLQ